MQFQWVTLPPSATRGDGENPSNEKRLPTYAHLQRAFMATKGNNEMPGDRGRVPNVNILKYIELRGVAPMLNRPQRAVKL